MRSPDPEETNPCDPDTDRDSNPGSVNAFGAAGGNSSDAEERQRGTNPLDFDGLEDDQLWLEDPDGDGVADAVALDVNSNGQVDARIEASHCGTSLRGISMRTARPTTAATSSSTPSAITARSSRGSS